MVTYVKPFYRSVPGYWELWAASGDLLALRKGMVASVELTCLYLK